jgi:hypothetical protein
VGLSYNATDAQKADITDAIIDGVHYYCTLNASSPTSVVVANGGSTLDLVFDKTEYTYSGTVSTTWNADVTISGTSTTGTAINKTAVTDYSGTATISGLPVGTYTVTAAKNDYTPQSTSITISDGGQNTASVSIFPSEDGVIYVENGINANHINLINSDNIRFQNGKFQMYNSDYTIPVDGNGYEKYTVTVPGLAFTHNNGSWSTRSASLSVVSGNTVIAKVNMEYTHVDDVDGVKQNGIETNSLIVGDQTEEENISASGDLTVVLDTLKSENNITVTWGNETYTGTTTAKSITGIRILANNQLYAALSSILVTGESISPDTASIMPVFVAEDGETKLGGSISSVGLGGKNGSTIATAFTLTNSIAAGTTIAGIAWDIAVPSGSYVKTKETKFDAFKESEEALAGSDIFATKSNFNLRFVHEMPAITGANVLVGLVINNVYVNGGSASASYITDTYATTVAGEAYNTYDKLTVGAGESGVYDMSLGTAATSETTAFGELMSIDSILTMMYDEDELAEITGDIASEDNADIAGIDDEIDMTDYNDNGEAVGE